MNDPLTGITHIQEMCQSTPTGVFLDDPLQGITFLPALDTMVLSIGFVPQCLDFGGTRLLWAVDFGPGSIYNRHGSQSQSFRVRGSTVGAKIEALVEALHIIHEKKIISRLQLRTVYIRCSSAYLEMKLTNQKVRVEPGFPRQEPPQLAQIRCVMEEMVHSRNGELEFKLWRVGQEGFRRTVVMQGGEKL